MKGPRPQQDTLFEIDSDEFRNVEEDNSKAASEVTPFTINLKQQTSDLSEERTKETLSYPLLGRTKSFAISRNEILKNDEIN